MNICNSTFVLYFCNAIQFIFGFVLIRVQNDTIE